MSSFRMLAFKVAHPDKVWSAGSDNLSLIVRRTDHGYLAFVQKWSHEANAYTIEPIQPEHGMLFYRTREQAENACQRRYEQELRWSHRWSSASPRV